MDLVDLHNHPFSHGEFAEEVVYSEVYLDKFAENARARGIKYLGFSDHDRLINPDRVEETKNIISKLELTSLVGIEYSYNPGQEKKISRLIEDYQLDYAIGSVHEIGNWEFDHPDYIEEYQNHDIDQLYKEYFYLLKKAVESNLFDIIGHFDLIKVFGYRPVKLNLLRYIEPVLELIKTKGIAVEINTNGLNKPVAEVYPSLSIIKRLIALKIPITFGSDAHIPARCGEGIASMAKWAYKQGLKEIVYFQKRKMKKIKLT